MVTVVMSVVKVVTVVAEVVVMVLVVVCKATVGRLKQIWKPLAVAPSSEENRKTSPACKIAPFRLDGWEADVLELPRSPENVWM